jgi:hypothetical protein
MSPSGHARFVLAIVAVLLVMAAVWTWLPPADETQAAIQDALVRFETAQGLVWPEGHYDQTTLPPKVQDELREQWRTALGAVAEGQALEDELADDPVVWLLKAPRILGGRLPLQSEGEVVYFDFKRRTARGEVKVTAAVDITKTTGRWSPRAGQIVDVAEDEPDEWCALSVYTLRQRGDTWRVVDVEPASGPNGGPPYFYNPATGEFTQDPGA